MPPNSVQNRSDSAEDRLKLLWQNVEPAMAAIYDLKNPLSIQDYMKYYHYIFEYSVIKGNGLSAVDQFTIDSGSKDLYLRIKKWLDDHLSNVLKDGTALEGEEMLRFYDAIWTDYRFSSRVLHGVCMYMNRHYISRLNRDRKQTGEVIHEIYGLALVLWRERLFAQVTPVVLQLIDRDRKGEVIDKNLIKFVVDCSVELGTGDADSKDSSAEAREMTRLAVYRDYFEKQMLTESAEFCSNEAAALISSLSVPEYMKRVIKRIDIETERVRETMHPSTSPKLIRVVERAMIEDHLDFFRAEFSKLLAAYSEDDLTRMYHLLSRIPDSGLPALRNQFMEYVKEQGKLAISSCADKAATDPVLFVETLLSVHKKYSQLIQSAFEGESGFGKSLDQSCMSFVNENAVKSGGKSSARTSAELLAKYCDMLLKKSNRNESTELGKALSDAIIIFNYIDEKDVFQKYSKTLLAKRLVGQLSVSDDAEAEMVSKLKSAAGIAFSNPMERMISDIRLSSDFQSQYSDFMKGKTALKFGINFYILTTMTWPLSVTEERFLLPSELETAVSTFTAFYNGKQAGRKLIWIWNTCTGDILYQNYVFHVSTFQMAVLLQFNNADEFTIEALAANTGLEMPTMKQLLHTLVKINLLKSSDTTVADLYDGSAPESAVIRFNTSYKNRKHRLNINVPLRVEVNREDDKVQKQVDEDRKMVIQAAIVRIMKMRQRITHQQLLAEIPSQVNKFKPTVAMIKTCIEYLIGKEYMNREDVTPVEYTYIA